MARNRRKTYDEAAAGSAAEGIPCRDCGCRHSYIIRTERVGEIVRRARRCRHCGRIFFTTESQ